MKKTRKTAAHGRRRDLERELAAAGDKDRAKTLAWFFKTGKGEYAEGDQFLGLTVPAMRRIALRYRGLGLKELESLLASSVHEHRAAALEILVAQFEHGGEIAREQIARFYLNQTRRINNWDLVDGSAPYIMGAYLLSRPREVLDQLAGSENLWERRIAIVFTFAFLKQGSVEDTFRIAERLITDKHDLIHKATGWALREAGKVCPPALIRFLRKHYNALPRTTLRYAIERFPANQRRQMLGGVFPD